MAHALLSGRANRASGDLAFHVLDVMHAALTAEESQAYVEVESDCERPAAFPTGLATGVLDA